MVGAEAEPPVFNTVEKAAFIIHTTFTAREAFT